MATIDPRSERILSELHPDLARVIRRAFDKAPFAFRLTEGLRSEARQRELVRIRASKTMRSRHLPHPKDGLSRAVDLIPMVDIDTDGKIEVEEMYAWPLYHRLAPVIKQAAADLGVPIEWGGDWRSFKDGPHWQLPWKAYP